MGQVSRKSLSISKALVRLPPRDLLGRLVNYDSLMTYLLALS